MPSTSDVVVLCGGAGLRLRSVIGEAPKSMAAIGGRPFLELLLEQLQRHGFRRVILAVGYQRDVIRERIREQAAGLSVVYSVESEPLGTGGALRNAADLVQSDSAMVMNGDSYTDVDLRQFVADYDDPATEAAMVVVPADGRGDCGSVLVDAAGRVVAVDEKQAPFHAPHLNAGIYLLSRRLFYDIPSGRLISLEREIFPRWLLEGRSIRAFVHMGSCVDIGTPERYRIAQESLAGS